MIFPAGWLAPEPVVEEEPLRSQQQQQQQQHCASDWESEAHEERGGVGEGGVDCSRHEHGE